MKKKQAKKVKLLVVFGTEAVQAYEASGWRQPKLQPGQGKVKNITFKTVGERKAYIKGMDDAAEGWNRYHWEVKG